MNIRIKNLGILKHAEFSLGDLTIICGENNTGKTYATYALYGFLNSWREWVNVEVSDTQIQRLLTDGVIKIGLAQYIETAHEMIAEACERYTNQLDSVFAAPEGQFSNAEFRIRAGAIDILDKAFERAIAITRVRRVAYTKQHGSQELRIALPVEQEQEGEIDPTILKDFIPFTIKNTVFGDSFPSPFISSTERTGAAIFRKELSFARDRLHGDVGLVGQNINVLRLLQKAYQRYPRSIENNVDFIRRLEDTTGRRSFISKECPEVLDDFADIIGGDYQITQYDQLYYIPKGTGLKLTMDQSSSAVRSLLDIGFYLRHTARWGDLLMVDEPELNLHPANQRRIARLFARLVNLGVKVFITTHSDYIIKELNTLIMLNHDKPHLKRIAEENGYRQSELLRSDQVKVYMAREELMPLEEGQKRRRRGHTLMEADIAPELGIEAPSFDETIDEMNSILDDIVWGAE